MGAADLAGRGDGDAASRTLLDLADATARRSLALLRAIEETIRTVDGVAAQVRSLTAPVVDLTEHLWKARPGKVELDSAGEIDARFASGQELAERVYADYQQRLAFVERHPLVEPDDGLADCYREALEALRGLHEALGELRIALGEYDADSSPVAGGPHDSVDDLFAALDR